MAVAGRRRDIPLCGLAPFSGISHSDRARSPLFAACSDDDLIIPSAIGVVFSSYPQRLPLRLPFDQLFGCRKNLSCQALQFCNDCGLLQEVSGRGDSAVAMKWRGRSSVERAAAALFILTRAQVARIESNKVSRNPNSVRLSSQMASVKSASSSLRTCGNRKCAGFTQMRRHAAAKLSQNLSCQKLRFCNDRPSSKS